MNMGMVAPTTLCAVQDSYCVEAVKQFWEEERATVIDHLCTKDSVVAMGE